MSEQPNVDPISTPQPDPSQSQQGQSEQGTQAPLNSDLPEKFKGKDVKDIVKSYEELEKKFGETSRTVEEARRYEKQVQEWESLLQRNPDLYNAALEARKKELGQNPSKEENKSNEARPVSTESDQYLRSKAMASFEGKFLSNFDADKKKDLYEKTARKFMDMRDPGGVKDFKSILQETPLSQLDGFLEDAFFLATRDAAISSGNSQDFASIGSMPSSNRKSEANDLTEDEKAAAGIFGMTPEEYKKYKK